jgi:hypothetical protein
MRTEQRVFRFRMVETVYVPPGFHIMASLAAEGCTVSALAGHLLIELALVRVLVAGGAAPVFEMEGQNFVRAPSEAKLMAIGAWDCGVGSLEREGGGAMFRDGIGGAAPILNGMAIFAAIVVRSGGKLAVVRILVAIRASRKLHFVNRIFACGNMTLGAFHLDVLAAQWILGGVVFLDPEQRWLPTVDRMTLGAFPFFRTSVKLPLMRIRCVAVFAVSKGNFLLEVVLQVASRTSNLGMFSQQWVLGF